MYLDGPGVKEYSQHCQVFALLTDTVTVENGRIYLERTLSDSETYAQCSVAWGIICSVLWKKPVFMRKQSVSGISGEICSAII